MAFFRSQARKGFESEDKARRFSERYYGRFERRIQLEDVEEQSLSLVQEWRADYHVAEVR